MAHIFVFFAKTDHTNRLFFVYVLRNMFSDIPDFFVIFTIHTFLQKPPDVKILRLGCHKTVIYSKREGIWDKKTFSLNSPTCCLKSIPKPFFTNSRVCALACPIHELFSCTRVFDYMRWFSAKCVKCEPMMKNFIPTRKT